MKAPGKVKAGVEPFIKITVLDDAGHRVRDVDADNPNRGFWGSFVEVVLHPGDSVIDEVSIGTGYHLMPGKYSVQIERLVGKTWIKSSVIGLTVTPPL